MSINLYSIQYTKCTQHICTQPSLRKFSLCNVRHVSCTLLLTSTDVDIVQKIVILVPVSVPFALKTLELITNNWLHVKKIT